MCLCRGAVLCVVMSSNGEQCFSGGVDATIQSWNTPNPNIDPYDSYGAFHNYTFHILGASDPLFLSKYFVSVSGCDRAICSEGGAVWSH